MNIFRKKKLEDIAEAKRKDLDYLFDSLSSELVTTEKKMEDVTYQIEFFGTTPKLEEEKKDCELMLSWIQGEFDEIKKGLFKIQAQQITQ